MKNKELDNILDIISFSKSIETLYKKLAKLEKEGKKDTEEYDEIHGLISSCIQIENKKYKNIENLLSNDIVEIQKLIESLNNKSEDDYLNVTELGKDNSHQRLFSHLRDYSLLRAEEIPNEETEDKKDDNESKKRIVFEIGGLRLSLNKNQLSQMGLLNNKEEKSQEDIDAEHENHVVVCDLIYYKYALINSYFMDYLIEAIDNCNNKSIKNRLIDYKYSLIYTCSTLEKSFSKDKDNFTKTYLYESIIEAKSKLNQEEYDYTYSKILEMDTIETINSVSQANYIEKESNIKEKVSSIIKTLYAKAMVSAMYNEEALETAYLYYEASKISCASSDDLKNMDIIFDQEKIHKLSKKVD